MNRIVFLLFIFFIGSNDPSVFSQSLFKKMKMTRLGESEGIPIVRRQGKAFLIVKTTIPDLNFATNNGIIEKRSQDDDGTLWHLIIEQGTHCLTFSAPGYQSLLKKIEICDASLTISIDPIDNVSPEINHTPNLKMKKGEDLCLDAIVTDDIGIESVIVFYRYNDNQEYIPMLMNRRSTESDSFFCNIPVVSDTIQYYISANDYSGNSPKLQFSPTNPMHIFAQNISRYRYIAYLLDERNKKIYQKIENNSEKQDIYASEIIKQKKFCGQQIFHINKDTSYHLSDINKSELFIPVDRTCFINRFPIRYIFHIISIWYYVYLNNKINSNQDYVFDDNDYIRVLIAVPIFRIIELPFLFANRNLNKQFLPCLNILPISVMIFDLFDTELDFFNTIKKNKGNYIISDPGDLPDLPQ